MTIFGAASPNDHKSISEEEKMFIFGDRSDKLIKVSSFRNKQSISDDTGRLTLVIPDLYLNAKLKRRKD